MYLLTYGSFKFANRKKNLIRKLQSVKQGGRARTDFSLAWLEAA